MVDTRDVWQPSSPQPISVILPLDFRDRNAPVQPSTSHVVASSSSFFFLLLPPSFLPDFVAAAPSHQSRGHSLRQPHGSHVVISLLYESLSHHYVNAQVAWNWYTYKLQVMFAHSLNVYIDIQNKEITWELCCYC